MKKRLTRIAAAAIAAVTVCGSMLTGCGSSSGNSSSSGNAGASGAQAASAADRKLSLIIKAPVIRLSPDFDKEVETSYDFLVKAAAAFEESYEDADLSVNVLQFDSAEYPTAIEQCFDTDESADILYGDFFNIESYVYSGRVVPLDDVISEEVRSDIDDNFWEMSMMNGKTYMMPFLYRQNVLGYNKELFRECGLDRYCTDESVVQTWTMDEWNEILEALKENLPEDKFALMMYAANNQGDTHVMSYIRSQGSSFFNEDGRFDLNTEQGIAGLQWIKDMQTKEYFPKNAAKLMIADNNDMFVNQQLAIYIVNDATENVVDFDRGFVNFPYVNGGISTNFNTGFEVFDNGDPDKLAAAKAFIKFIYESDWLDYSIGSIPCSTRVAEKYTEELKNVQKYLDNAATGVRFTGGNPNWIGVRAAFYPNIQKLLTGEYTAEEAAKHLDEDCNAAIQEGYETAELHE